VRESVSDEIVSVTRRTLEDDDLKERAHELTKAIVQSVLDDPNITVLASKFVVLLFQMPETRSATASLVEAVRLSVTCAAPEDCQSNLLSPSNNPSLPPSSFPPLPFPTPQVLKEPATRQQAQIFFSWLAAWLAKDPATQRQIAELMSWVLAQPSTQAAAVALSRQVLADPVTRSQAALLIADIMKTEVVVQQAAELGNATAHSVLNDPSVKAHTVDFFTHTFNTPEFQRSGGQALKGALYYSFTPSTAFGLGRLLSRSSQEEGGAGLDVQAEAEAAAAKAAKAEAAARTAIAKADAAKAEEAAAASKAKTAAESAPKGEAETGAPDSVDAAEPTEPLGGENEVNETTPVVSGTSPAQSGSGNGLNMPSPSSPSSPLTELQESEPVRDDQGEEKEGRGASAAAAEDKPRSESPPEVYTIEDEGLSEGTTLRAGDDAWAASHAEKQAMADDQDGNTVFFIARPGSDLPMEAAVPFASATVRTSFAGLRAALKMPILTPAKAANAR
jgi:hypothetical protein